jgi:hypothetical protein
MSVRTCTYIFVVLVVVIVVVAVVNSAYYRHFQTRLASRHFSCVVIYNKKKETIQRRFICKPRVAK